MNMRECRIRELEQQVEALTAERDRLREELVRASRLLELCEFSAPEDLEDCETIMKAAMRKEEK